MFSAFNTIKTTELKLSSMGWFRPWYQLGDGQAVYGRLNYEGFFRTKAIAETAAAKWTFEKASFWGRTINISAQGAVIGRLKLGMFSKASLLMDDGFEAEFNRDSVWRSGFTWNTQRFGEIVKMKQKPFGRCINITLDPNTSKIDLVPMLCFLGAHFMFIKQRQAAAAAHG